MVEPTPSSNKKSLNILIFSKDRPFQLQQMLLSFKTHFLPDPQHLDTNIHTLNGTIYIESGDLIIAAHVLYTFSDEKYGKLYQ